MDESALAQSSVKLVVQVNGKVRGNIEVPADTAQEEILNLAKAEQNVVKHMQGKEIVKEIVVPDKLVNVVVR